MAQRPSRTGRTEVLYSRITPELKQRLEDRAEQLNISLALLVDQLLTESLAHQIAKGAQ